jgi:uncharacterized membrane-anchored protein YhcB (DUF1043 family)
MDSELKQYLDEFSERTDAQFRQVRDEITAAKTEMKLHFDSTAERFESKFELLSEGIQNVDQRLGREAADIRSEMRQGFADTQALIRSLKLPARRRRASRRPTKR